MTREQMQESFVQQYKTPCDTCKSGWGVELDVEVFRRIITEVWNEAVKECEGCVPEKRKNGLPPNAKTYEFVECEVDGHNSCREQTLQAIRRLKNS